MTYSQGGAAIKHDQRANKTIVIIGSDCWMVIGFTGIAYLGGRPTDQFIAEAVTGESIPSEVAVIQRPQERSLRLHFNEIGKRIVESVSAEFKKLPASVQKHRLMIIGSGLQFTKPRWRHQILHVEFSESGWNSGGSVGKYQPWNSIATHVAGDVQSSIMKEVRNRILSEGYESPERVRSIMVEAIRDTASVSRYVGKNAVSAILAPEHGEIGIYFDLDESGPPILPSFEAASEIILPSPALYTPYVIMPSAVFCPSVSSVGSWVVDGIRLRFCGIESTVGGGLLSAYRREPPPGARR